MKAFLSIGIAVLSCAAPAEALANPTGEAAAT